MPSLRAINPDPLLEMNPQTAEELGLKEGDWAALENPYGRAVERVRLSAGIHPRVVHAQHGWWFPEQKGEEPNLFGVWKSSVNSLVPNEKISKMGYGANYKSTLCKVAKSNPRRLNRREKVPTMKNKALVVDYKYCTGCHSCEVACRNEKDIPLEEWGIRLADNGPIKLGGTWRWDDVPMPTQLCDLCEDRLSEGKKPACVHHCLAQCLTVVALDELPHPPGRSATAPPASYRSSSATRILCTPRSPAGLPDRPAGEIVQSSEPLSIGGRPCASDPPSSPWRSNAPNAARRSIP